MTSHRVHRAISRLLLGESHDDVNKLMDLPAKIMGKRHRLIFHDPLSAFILFGGNPEKFKAALLHILVDELSKDPKVKKILESLF